MRTNVRDTSIEAYQTAPLGAQQQRIYGFLMTWDRPFTRGEIAAMTGLGVNAVCGRVFELIERGKLVELPARKCKFSGRSAHPVALAPRQMELVA